MNSFGLPAVPHTDTFVFTGNAISNGSDWAAWRKPKNRSMASFFLLGGGGGGGTGVVGANSTAAGGGGGGSGCQTQLMIPLAFLPDVLYISVGIGKTGAGVQTYVSIEPSSSNANSILANAANGTAGGNASGATAGSAGSTGAAATAGVMPLGWQWATLALAGQAGIIGGTTGAAGALTLPVTGLRVTGGTGGAGLGAAGSNGTAGGSFNTPASPSPWPAQVGGPLVSSATTPASNGSNGFQVTPCGLFFYGGTGAGATHGTATGGGLVQGSGGDGAFGCGGGGMGGALTASTAGVQSKGGSGLCVITCW